MKPTWRVSFLPRLTRPNQVMAQLNSLVDVADPYDVIVLDQWGVLHNGSTPYEGAPEAMIQLAASGKRLAVLSNSGKRADLNSDRIANMGLPMETVVLTMTSGEACWNDFADGRRTEQVLFAITGKPDDSANWSQGLDVSFVDDLSMADAVLLMGLPEGSTGKVESNALNQALELGLTVICTNPDRASPRVDGTIQISPGALAHNYKDRGGDVIFYGKPHRPIYDRLIADLNADPMLCLMVGDSLEHDIAGAQNVGMASAFVTSGLHAAEFNTAGDPVSRAASLASQFGLQPPTHVIDRLS